MDTNLPLQSYIDHTLLRPDASEIEIQNLCGEAKKYRFKTVCIESKWLSKAVEWLKGSEVLPITVISFPHGTDSLLEKCRQIENAIRLGAKEVDVVLNRNLLKEKKYSLLLEELKALVKAAGQVPVKVIFETSELTAEEIVAASVLCAVAQVAFVKTSTGFSKSGAKVEDVVLMRKVVGENMGVKASGGVRSWEDARKMIEAGANRLGTSAGVAIVTGQTGKLGY